jgi:uncharacterized DUF497 family protein
MHRRTFVPWLRRWTRWRKTRIQPQCNHFTSSDITRSLGLAPSDFRLVLGRTKIEYDPDKEDKNRRKHKYSLASAVDILERMLYDTNRRPHAISDAFTEKGEIRHIHLTFDDAQKVVMMVTTMRPNDTVRVISFRRAGHSYESWFRNAYRSCG